MYLNIENRSEATAWSRPGVLPVTSRTLCRHTLKTVKLSNGLT